MRRPAARRGGCVSAATPLVGRLTPFVGYPYDTGMIPHLCRFASAFLAVVILAGCSSTPKVSAGKDDPLALLVARQIRIQPFTKIKSLDDDQIPDGILLVLRPTDVMGDPVKIFGRVYFELYAYQNASGERKGERLEFWERSLATPDDQKLYWDRTAQMYEFPLAWTQGVPSSPVRKYVLTATYRTPWDETLADEYVMEWTAGKGLLSAPATQPSR